MNVDESVDDVIVGFSLDDRPAVPDSEIDSTHHELKRRSFDGSSLAETPSQLTTTKRSHGGPMWSTAKNEDDSSLDGFLPSGSKAVPTPRSPTGEERPLPPPASPFSELFPIRLLSESGVDLADLNQQPTTSHDRRKEEQKLIVAQLAAAQRTKQPHGAKTHFCTQCCAGFTRRYSLNKHVHEKHALAPMRHCPLTGCTFVTRNVNSFLLHKRNHQRPFPGKPQYFCKLCRCRYTQRRSLLQHLTNHHGSDASLIGIGGVGDAAAHLSAKSAGEQDAVEDGDGDGEPVEPIATVPIATVPIAAVAQEQIQIAAKKLTRSAARISASSSVSCSTASLTDFAAGAAPQSSPPLKSRVSKKTPPPSTGKKTYACERCDFQTTTFRKLFAHRQKQHAAKESATVACVYCRKQFSFDRVVAHMKSCHLNKAKRSSKSAKRFACDSCEFQTTTKRVFTAHKTMHAVEDQQRPPPPTIQAARPEAPTASVAPYIKSRRSPCPMIPTIPHELETVMNSLNQANSSFVQLIKRKDNEIRDLRANVSRLLQLLLPSTHPLQPALVSNLISGPQIDQTVLSVISSHPAAM